MIEKKYLINIVFIILIFIVLALNQHPWFKDAGRNIYFRIWEIIQNIWQRIQYLFNKYVLSRISGEVEKRKGEVETELETQKQTVKQEIGKTFNNIIQKSKIFLKSLLQNIF